MNKRGRKTNGLSHRLIALLLCCVCLVTVLPLSAIALAPDETAAAAEEIAPEEPTVDIAEEPEAPDAEEPTTEPVTEEPADTATEEPETPDAEEPDTEPDTDSAEQRAVDALYRYLMACTSYEEMNAAIDALGEDELYLMNQFTAEQNAALEARMQELGGYASDVYANPETRQKECKIAQGDEDNITVTGTLTDSIDCKFIDSDGNQITVEGITAEFESSNTRSYKIKVEDSVPVGTYTMIVSYTTTTGFLAWTKTTEYEDTITITVTKPGEEAAKIYYLKTPTSDPRSNETTEWGDCIGNGTVNTTDATWEHDDNNKEKNIFDNVSSYVVDLADDMVKQPDGSWLISKEKYSTYYTAIYNAYRTKLQDELGVTLQESDIEAIYLTPYKISKNNGSDPDKHIDCTVDVKTKTVFAARFWVTLPNGSQPILAEGKNYKSGERVIKTTMAPTSGTTGDYPETTEVGGIMYRFVGWYDEENKLIPTDKWESGYLPSNKELENGSVDFYARYEPVTANLTITKTLSGNMYNEKDEFAFTVIYDGKTETFPLGNDGHETISIPVGASVTISEKPDGYKSSLASTTLTDLEGKWKDNSITFTMPAENVAVTINNDKTITIDAGVVVSTLPYVLMLAVVVGGVTVTVKRRKHRRED